MKVQAKTVIVLIVASGVASIATTLHTPSLLWTRFFVYLLAILLSSGMKVGIPKCEGTMSVNFPFILLGIAQLSPLQAVGLAVCSVLALCNFRVVKRFTIVQTVFNLANVTLATVVARSFFLWLMHHHFQIAPAIAAAAVVYFLTNSLPITFIIASESGASIVSLWRAEFLWYVPFYLVGGILAAAADLISSAFGWMTSMLLVPLVYTIYRAYAAQVAIARDREQHIVENEALHLRTIEGLAMAIEAKDQGTHEHLQRVRVYVAEIGKVMGLEQSLMQALLTAAFLHDIGKLAVPEYIINKPGKLTREEFEKMKIHPVVGADILERVNFPYPVVPIVRSHHEAWDGTGYPDGLKGEEIPIGARILTVVDCFDALASDRPYRKALSLDEAMNVVRKGAGIQFDPHIVSLLESRYLSLEEKARQQIGMIEPLKTDLLVKRGGAPGAGLEPEHQQIVPVLPFLAGSAATIEFAGGTNPSASHHLPSAAGEQARQVFELIQMIGSCPDPQETSRTLSRRLRAFVPHDCLAIYLKRGELLIPHSIDSSVPKAFLLSVENPVGEGLSGWVAKSALAIVNGNPTVEPAYQAESNLFTPGSSALAIPLFDLSGVLFGVLTLYSVASAAFSRDHLRLLQSIEPTFSMSLGGALDRQEAQSDTIIDPTTRLPDRKHFVGCVEVEMERARLLPPNGSSTTIPGYPANDHSFAVAVCDVTGLQAVYEQHGHTAGNHLLRLIAETFRESCRTEDTVARTGAEEFIFLFPSMTVESAHRRLGILERGVKRACTELEIEVSLAINVGLAFYPQDGSSPEELLTAAGHRVHLQKQNPGETSVGRRPDPAKTNVAAA